MYILDVYLEIPLKQNKDENNDNKDNYLYCESKGMATNANVGIKTIIHPFQKRNKNQAIQRTEGD